MWLFSPKSNVGTGQMLVMHGNTRMQERMVLGRGCVVQIRALTLLLHPDATGQIWADYKD